jgi:molybdate transport system substrate-binding protein
MSMRWASEREDNAIDLHQFRSLTRRGTARKNNVAKKLCCSEFCVAHIEFPQNFFYVSFKLEASMPEIRVLALQSPQIIINELAAEFEQRSGYKITQLLRLTDMPIHIKQKTDAGEVFDVAFVVPAVLDQLEKADKIIGNSRTNFLRVPIGVAVRTGNTKPDISSVEAFKRTLLEVKSIAYLRAGTSGPYLQGLFERFGIAEEIQSKAKRTETDTVGELVAEGDAEIGVTAIATLIATPGVDIVGPLPSEIQSYVFFAGAISTNAGVPDVARDLIKFLTGPTAIPVIRSKGMEPWE